AGRLLRVTRRVAVHRTHARRMAAGRTTIFARGLRRAACLAAARGRRHDRDRRLDQREAHGHRAEPPASERSPSRWVHVHTICYEAMTVRDRTVCFRPSVSVAVLLWLSAPALGQTPTAPPPPPKIWTLSASAGLAFTQGNTDTSSVNLGYNIAYDPQ